MYSQLKWLLTLSSYNMQIFTVYQTDDQIFDTEKINCTLKRWKISRARKSVTHVLCSCCIYICCFLYMHVCTLPICIHMHHILDRSNKLKEKNQLELITVLCTYIWLGSMQSRRAFLSCLGIGTHVGSLTMTQPLFGYSSSSSYHHQHHPAICSHLTVLLPMNQPGK